MSRVAYIQFYSAPEIDTQYRIELHKVGFSGTERRLNGTGRYFDHNYQSLNPREPQKTVLLDSRLTLSIQARESADIALLEDIFTSDPGEYTIRKYVNNVLEWTGQVDTDRVRYPRMGFPFDVQIVARDIEPTKGELYTLTTGRVTIIEAIAEMLPLTLPIRTVTSWKGTGISASEDFLNERYIDRTALRTFARNGDEPDEAITKYKALEVLCKNFGLLLHQSGNAWRLVQLSALTSPATTRVYSYLTDGTPDGSSVTDLRVVQDRENLFIRPVSDFIGARSYKEVQARFDHRTVVSGLQFPTTFQLDDGTLTRTFTDFFNTDGNQSLNLTGFVRARFDDTVTDATVLFEIKALDRYWNATTNAWQAGEIANPIEMTDTELSEGKLFFEAFVNFTTSDIPETAGNSIDIKFFVARQVSSSIVSDFTDYSNFRLQIINPSVEDGNNTAIDYRLTQVLNHSERYNHGSVWYGDGPTSYAVSAISEDSAGATLTASNWGRQGETYNQDFFRVLTREVMDTQRNASRAFSPRLFGAYSPNQILIDDSNAYLFIGGSQSGKANEWQADLVKIQVQTAGTDTFEIIYRTETDGTTSGGSSGGGGTGGGISQAFADNRYNRRTLNLSDVTNVSDARHNLGLGDPAIIEFNEPLYDNAIDESGDTYLDIRNASPFERGVVTNEAQTFGGAKTFEQPIRLTAQLTDPAPLSGALWFDEDNQSIAYYDENGNKTILDQVVKVRIKNNQGATITRGQVVRVCTTGFAGNLTCVRLAQANTANNSNVVGVVLDSSITNGSVGKVVEFGKVEGLNTSAYTVGDVLWLDPSSAGSLTTSKPTYPNFAVRIGYVTRVSSTEGSIIVLPERNFDIFTSGRVMVANGDGRIGQFADINYNDSNKELTVPNYKLEDKLHSVDAFTPGWTGSGLRLQRDSGEWELELDNLYIRGALFASELIINQISALNGSDILSPGRGKVESIEHAVPDEEEIVISDPQGGSFASFAVNDIVLIQQFRPNDSAVVKRIVRQVLTVTGDAIALTTTAGAPSDVGVIEVGDLIVAVGNTTNTARQNSIFRTVVDANNPFTAVFTGVASWADWLSQGKTALRYGNLNGSYGYATDIIGFGAGSAAGSNLTLDPTNGLRLRAASSVLAQLSGDTFKIGTTNYIEFDSSDGELDINTTILKLTTAGLRLDSSIDKKIIINNGTFDTITIGDFDFGAVVDNDIVAATTTGTTTSIFTSGTIGYPAGQITSTIGVIETDNRATDQLIISGFRQIDAIKGKWARIRFDWIANAYDSSLPAFSVGYEITYPGGPAVQNVGRDPEDIERSGSVDTGFVFVPDAATPRITVNLLAPDGGLIIGDVHERVRIENIVVEYKDDTTYVDIGNTGMRIYKSGGKEGVFFDADNSEINLKRIGIGEWSFRILNNSNLGLFYRETLRQTFTTS
jgi:hypothetical protein